MTQSPKSIDSPKDHTQAEHAAPVSSGESAPAKHAERHARVVDAKPANAAELAKQAQNLAFASLDALSEPEVPASVETDLGAIATRGKTLKDLRAARLDRTSLGLAA